MEKYTTLVIQIASFRVLLMFCELMLSWTVKSGLLGMLWLSQLKVMSQAQEAQACGHMIERMKAEPLLNITTLKLTKG